MDRDILYEIMMHLDLDSINQMRLVSTQANEIYHEKNFILHKFILNIIKHPFIIQLNEDIKGYLPSRILSKLDKQDEILSIEHFSGKYYKVLIWRKNDIDPTVKKVFNIKYKNSTISYDELIALLIHIYLYNPKLII